MPRPRGFHDVFQLGILRLPTEFGVRLVRRSDELGRVAGAAGFFNHRDFFAGDFLASLDDFLHGIAVAVAEVEEAALARCRLLLIPKL